MDLDDTVKYLIWVVVFALLLGGVYFLLKRIGILS
jgi:hypothetical protein